MTISLRCDSPIEPPRKAYSHVTTTCYGRSSRMQRRHTRLKTRTLLTYTALACTSSSRSLRHATHGNTATISGFTPRHGKSGCSNQSCWSPRCATKIYITLGADIHIQAKNKILDDAKDFLSNEKWYTERGQSTSNVYSMISYMLTRRIQIGIPYRCGYLLVSTCTPVVQTLHDPRLARCPWLWQDQPNPQHCGRTRA